MFGQCYFICCLLGVLPGFYLNHHRGAFGCVCFLSGAECLASSFLLGLVLEAAISFFLEDLGSFVGDCWGLRPWELLLLASCWLLVFSWGTDGARACLFSGQYSSALSSSTVRGYCGHPFFCTPAVRAVPTASLVRSSVHACACVSHPVAVRCSTPVLPGMC